MSMKIPAGDPYGVGVSKGPTEAIGLVDAPKAQYSELNAIKGLDKAAAQLEKSAEAWRKEQEDLRFNEKINESKAFQMDLETEYKNLKGKNALERPDGLTLSDEYAKKWDEHVAQVNQSGLSTYNKKRLQQYYDASRNNLINGINQHVIAQSKVYRKSVDETSIDLAMRMAVSGGPQESRDGMYAMKSIVDRRAKEDGVEPDYAKSLGKVELNQILFDIDEGNLTSAANRLEANQYMSTSDRLRAKRSLQVAKRKAESASGENYLTQVYEAVYSPSNMAITAAGEVTGQTYTSADYENALALANGDEQKAVQILAYGVDRYEQKLDEDDAKGIDTDEDAILAEDGNAKRAYDSYQSHMGSKPTMEATVKKIKELVPDIDDVVAGNVARKTIAKRRQALQAAQADRDQRTTIALGVLRQGNDFSSIPASVLEGLDRKTITSLKDYSARRLSGALVTNSRVYWDLLSDEEKLKKMSDEEFIRNSSELSEKDFDELSSYREALRTGKYKNVQGVKTRRVIKDVMARNGLSGSLNEKQKAAYGFVLKGIEDRVLQKVALAGKDLTDEEIANVATTALTTEFSIDENWAGVKKKRLDKVISSGGFSTDGDIDEVLDAGLEASGIDDPTKTNRSELLLSIGLTPTRPLPGAEAMVGAIQEKNPKFIDEIKRAYARAHGGAEPDPTFVVRAYLYQKNLFK